MARTNVNDQIIKIPPTGYNLTDSTDYIDIGSGLGFGIEFTWKANLLVFLFNPDDPSGVGFTVPPNGSRITAVSGVVNPWFATASPAGWQHIFRPSPPHRQDDGLMYIDALFSSKALIVEL